MIYFCTEEYIKLNTNIGKSVDAQTIVPLIKTAANMWVRSIMGTYFFNSMLTKYNANTLTTDEQTLVSTYIQPSVAWRTAYDVVLNSSYQIKNKGVQVQSGDYSASPEFKAIAFIAQQSVEKADFFDKRLSEYLVENRTLFADFTNPLNNDSTAKRSCGNDGLDRYQSGILFI